MKVSLNWLREFLPVEISPEELSRHLLMIGFEVAGIVRAGPQFSGVVIGEILEIRKHPNADRLSLCAVTDGTDTLSVVCGASNIAVGQRVPLARMGATLPGGRTIMRSTIRGVESQGMLCSAAELGLGEGNGGGIKILPPGTPVGQDASSLAGEADSVLEVEVTSNRADCLSHYGLARELGIYFQKPVNCPDAAAPAGAAASTSISIAIEDKAACGRYIGRVFESVAVGPSPAWMARRLEALGLRTINALVDVTNYAMLELGHPLHVFDLDTLEGGRIAVRFAKAGETIRALDGKDYALTPEDLVIADAAKPVAIAGVMGGEATGVTGKTTRVLLEAAHFAPGVVRRASQRLRLRSDSSYRFERGLAPQSAAAASARAARLILEVGGAPKERGLVDVYPAPVEPSPIAVTASRVEQILGVRGKSEKIESVLRALANRMTPAGEGWSFFPPAHRLDLKTVADLAEEAARHMGYDQIPSDAAPVKLQRPKSLPIADAWAEARRALSRLGFLEAYAYDFLSPQELARSALDAAQAATVLNPLSEDWTCLRPSLLPGLVKAAAYNFRRGARGLRLFELGKEYHRDGKDGRDIGERAMVAGLIAGTLPERPDWSEARAAKDPNRHLYEAKAACEELLLGCAARWSEGAGDALLHPKASLRASAQGRELARAGLVHPSVAQAWDLSGGCACFAVDLDALAGIDRPAPKLTPVSPFPSIVRDLSITVPDGTRYAQVEEALRGLPALLRLELLDRMSGEAAASIGLPAGRTGLTLRLTFSLANRTLRDDEANQAVAQGLKALEARCGAELRA